ncbi:MAG: amino acid ABC transporter permease [Lachnospiraceae bacterium]|nr:amino acid ABC transporter permease [Lachnospiraceae bacterium]
MKWLPSLIEGAKITISLTIVTTILGMLIGAIFALGKMSKIPGITHFCRAYIFFFRGTPLLMQLMFIYYSLPLINPNFAIQDRFLAAAIAFGLNSAAYCAELIRAAIESIDKGQFEVAKALGFTYGQTMRKIIIPQTYKRLVPPFANEFIMILKDASLTSIIALQDLSKVTTAIQSSSSKYTVFIPSMIIYLVITGVFSKLFECIEKKYSVYE